VSVPLKPKFLIVILGAELDAGELPPGGAAAGVLPAGGIAIDMDIDGDVPPAAFELLPPDDEELQADRARRAAIPAAAIESGFILRSTAGRTDRFTGIARTRAKIGLPPYGGREIYSTPPVQLVGRPAHGWGDRLARRRQGAISSETITAGRPPGCTLSEQSATMG
jgi:hypothetical protein